jgi:hypothetical protein
LDAEATFSERFAEEEQKEGEVIVKEKKKQFWSPGPSNCSSCRPKQKKKKKVCFRRFRVKFRTGVHDGEKNRMKFDIEAASKRCPSEPSANRVNRVAQTPKPDLDRPDCQSAGPKMMNCDLELLPMVIEEAKMLLELSDSNADEVTLRRLKATSHLTLESDVTCDV